MATGTGYQVVSVQPTVTGSSEWQVPLSYHATEAQAQAVAAAHSDLVDATREEFARSRGWIRRRTVVWPVPDYLSPAEMQAKYPDYYRPDYPM